MNNINNQNPTLSKCKLHIADRFDQIIIVFLIIKCMNSGMCQYQYICWSVELYCCCAEEDLPSPRNRKLLVVMIDLHSWVTWFLSPHTGHIVVQWHLVCSDTLLFCHRKKRCHIYCTHTLWDTHEKRSNDITRASNPWASVQKWYLWSWMGELVLGFNVVDTQK